jgi:glycosyltransferase involved in cell wall biosynthesis
VSRIPISVIVVTKNEAPRIGRCLAALTDFNEVVVVDSASGDQTKSIAEEYGARVVDFVWNGRYPKKRQWCLDTLDLRNDHIFFVDADEVVTAALAAEIRMLDWRCAGYFVRGRYVVDGKILRFGLQNNKLALLDRRKMEFPVVDDLDLPGMGEIEGHYQPVPKPAHADEKIGQVKESLLHYAYENESAWSARHHRYAAWERGMNARRAWPQDGRFIKKIFRIIPLKATAAFAYGYIFKRGFLDGSSGLKFAQSRYRYYRMTKEKYSP